MTAIRKSVSKKLRFDIFKRDNFRCGYCGLSIGDNVILEIDHIIPIVVGGDNSPINLVTACFDCNRGKSKHLLSKSDDRLRLNKDKVSLLPEQKRQLTAYIEFQREQSAALDELCSESIKPLFENEKDFTLPYGWRASISYFLKRLPNSEVREAAGIAVSKRLYGQKKFAYFCGICHNKIRNNEGEYVENQHRK